MAGELQTGGRRRWLVTAWPGMGGVAISAVVYLLSKLRMRQVREFDARDLFELDEAEVEDGLVRAARLPRSRLFLAEDAAPGLDLIAFLGEAQPPSGKLALCTRLLDAARELGAQRLVCFAAWAEGLEPSAAAHVRGVATDEAGLRELQGRGVAPVRRGRISGLNGVLLAAAAESGLPGLGLLGEMPALAPHLPYPSASAAVLRAFCGLSGMTLDLAELEAYGERMREQLSSAYQVALKSLQGAGPEPPEEPSAPITAAGGLDEEDARRVEELFAQAAGDRSKAFALKTELDRLGVFRQYEDRFLSLFRPEG
ncbi:MAG: PAC2 family protein [Elusimicrobia bacterium]|nr:PAC2 family protein [Elusimicrobiota bacterium]